MAILQTYQERSEKGKECFTYLTIFKCSKVTLRPRVSEVFDVSLHLAQSVPWMAGVGHALDCSATVQPQEAQLDHICTWIVKLIIIESFGTAFILLCHGIFLLHVCYSYCNIHVTFYLTIHSVIKHTYCYSALLWIFLQSSSNINECSLNTY